MTTLTITPIQPGHVQLSLDMTQYCQSYQNMILSEQNPDKPPRAQTEKEATQPTNEHISPDELQQQFYECRQRLEEHTNALAGEFIWKEIKQKIAANIPLPCLTSENNPSPMPLVIEVLDLTFVELLKNAMDAFLKNWLSNPQQTAILKMNIRLEITGEEITCIITDNGPGFSETFLEDFETYVHQKQYQERGIESEKASCSEYYFGGAGLGIRMICNYLLDGRRSLEEKEPFYDLSKGGTAIQLQNDSGAQIKLSAPLAPYPQIIAPITMRNAAFKLTIPEQRTDPAPSPHSSTSSGLYFDSSSSEPSSPPPKHHPFAPSPPQTPTDRSMISARQKPLPSHLKYMTHNASPSSFFRSSPAPQSDRNKKNQSSIVSLTPKNEPQKCKCCL